MKELKTYKVTFGLKGSNNNKINNMIKTVEEEHNETISKTEILNIAVDVFLNKLEAEDKTITDYLIQYNRL